MSDTKQKRWYYKEDSLINTKGGSHPKYENFSFGTPSEGQRSYVKSIRFVGFKPVY